MQRNFFLHFYAPFQPRAAPNPWSGQIVKDWVAGLGQEPQKTFQMPDPPSWLGWLV